MVIRRMTVRLGLKLCGNGLVNVFSKIIYNFQRLKKLIISITHRKVTSSHQRDSFPTQGEENIMFGHCVGERVSVEVLFRYGSCILAKCLVFAGCKQSRQHYVELIASSCFVIYFYQGLDTCILISDTANRPRLYISFWSQSLLSTDRVQAML